MMTWDEYWEKYRDTIAPFKETMQEICRTLDEIERTEQTNPRRRSPGEPR